MVERKRLECSPSAITTCKNRRRRIPAGTVRLYAAITCREPSGNQRKERWESDGRPSEETPVLAHVRHGRDRGCGARRTSRCPGGHGGEARPARGPGQESPC